jgi:hypothetical protein
MNPARKTVRRRRKAENSLEIERAAQAVPGDFTVILASAGNEPPPKGHEMPEGWLGQISGE